MVTNSSPHELRVRIQVIYALTILLSVRAIVVPLGIDRLTTLTWMKPLSIGIALFFGFASCFLVVGEVLVRRRPMDDGAAEVGRRHLGQSLKGIVVGLAIGFATYLIVGSLLGIVAQHLPGKTSTSDAIVTSVRKNHSPRNQCLLKVVAGIEGHAGLLKFCLVTAGGGSIGPESLRAGDAIRIRIRNTVLGTVVESANRV